MARGRVGAVVDLSVTSQVLEVKPLATEHRQD